MRCKRHDWGATDAFCLNEGWETAENMHRSGCSSSCLFQFLYLPVWCTALTGPAAAVQNLDPTKIIYYVFFPHFRSVVEFIFAFVVIIWHEQPYSMLRKSHIFCRCNDVPCIFICWGARESINLVKSSKLRILLTVTSSEAARLPSWLASKSANTICSGASLKLRFITFCTALCRCQQHGSVRPPESI